MLYAFDRIKPIKQASKKASLFPKRYDNNITIINLKSARVGCQKGNKALQCWPTEAQTRGSALTPASGSPSVCFNPNPNPTLTLIFDLLTPKVYRM